MDRTMVYPGAIPLETDLLQSEINAMLGIAGLASALFGSSTIGNGLNISPTSPASMSVQVGPGQIYASQNLDNSAFSSLPADTTHQIVKQGINLSPVVLACAAPVTAGTSINYLIEATLQEADTNPVVLPYYNASNPSAAYSGPANSGTAQPTRRRCTVALTAKPGIAAATGYQTTPAADAGYIGLCVVTVAYGATTITAGNISPISSGPVVPAGGILAALQSVSYASRAVTAAGTSTTQGVTPDGLAQATQSGCYLYATAGGAANALAAALTPAPGALAPGMQVLVKAILTNTGPATLNVSALGTIPIQYAGAPLKAGVLVSGIVYRLVYDGSIWQLKNPDTHGIVAYQQGQSGYRVYSNGDIDQWGHTATTDSSGKSIVVFPYQFPTSCDRAYASNDANSPPGAFHGCGSLTQTGMVVWSASSALNAAPNGTAAYWEAKGH